MKNFLVAYDLNKVKNYRRLIEELKRLNAKHEQGSVWTLRADRTVESLRDALKGFVDGDDQVIVVEVAARADVNPNPDWWSLLLRHSQRRGAHLSWMTNLSGVGPRPRG